ncbi:hypothetical protein niasHT_024676 [Heterodera trifolii]|uniref:Uncharacterized protein n=1 Tax=Heterodera trifolii TaxID=157864 RepID=A0ABD2K7P7_9BILA
MKQQQQHSPPENSSGSDSPPDPFKINQGSLTLSQLVQFLEVEHAETVELMQAVWRRRRLYKMPVRPPDPNNANDDRFFGYGDHLAEDVFYKMAEKTRNSIHGIIQLKVLYVGTWQSVDVDYHF